MRGTPELRYKYEVNGGIIPACAGNTSTTRERRCRPRDHPRVCGEHSLAAYTITLNPGSSPRVRGTLESSCFRYFPTGIIPACAGNTISPESTSCWSWDHPRVCGEHVALVAPALVQAGSSPRVRGTPERRRRRKRRHGIIPACAGNTLYNAGASIISGDHPRVCGEHPLVRTRICHRPGSSPRVRGTPTNTLSDPRCSGIIPACAGNTVPCGVIVFVGWDHPRVCGEHLGGLSAILFFTGSSPRVRGTHVDDPDVERARGIIPACAGNTTTPEVSANNPRDHPRVCGEHR